MFCPVLGSIILSLGMVYIIKCLPDKIAVTRQLVEKIEEEKQKILVSITD
ncbi:MAG: hypothetical protein AAF770_03055 [Bacteroidota bacterium]